MRTIIERLKRQRFADRIFEIYERREREREKEVLQFEIFENCPPVPLHNVLHVVSFHSVFYGYPKESNVISSIVVS